MLLAAAGLVTTEVILRKGLVYVGGSNVVFSGSDEISGYLFAVGTSWSLAHVLVTRGHVRIDALYSTFGPRVRGVLDIVALLGLGIFAAALLERSWNVASISFVDEVYSNTPLRVWMALPQIPWFAGILLFFLTLVLALLRAIAALVRGDYGAANAIAGVPTLDEEVAGELEGLGMKRGAEKA